MVSGIADVAADVVQQRRVLEPFAFFVGQAVDGARLIEERQREAHDLVRVIRVVGAALGQLQRAAAPHVGDVVDLRDLPPVAADVVEHEPFAQRQIAERQLSGAESAEDGVEHDRAGGDEVRTPRIETGNRQPLLEIEIDDFLAGGSASPRREDSEAPTAACRAPGWPRRRRC